MMGRDGRSNAWNRPAAWTRRRVLIAATGGAGISMAGCLGDDESGESSTQGAEPITAWNRIWFDAVRNLPQAPVAVARQGACLNVALADTVAQVRIAREEEAFEPYLDIHEEPPADASIESAVAGAANQVLKDLFPIFTDTFENRLEAALAEAEADETAIESGREFGESVATNVIDHREDDGHDDPEEPRYEACDGEMAPGCWRGPALDGIWSPSHYAFVDPWGITPPDGTEFGTPPDLDSQEYAEHWAEVAQYDYARGFDEEDEAIARYWFGGGGSTRPPGRWFRIASILAEQEELPILQTAKLFGQLGIGLADAGICVWKSKHTHGFWRPFTAIREGDTDGNPETEARPEWEPIKIGGGPEFPSGLACFGSTASEILATAFGSATIPFEMTTSGPPEQTRSFEGVEEAFEESVESRLPLGIHFRFSLESSIPVGREIAGQVVESYY